MIFGHAVIAWIFFLIFYYCKILNFGCLKVRFRRKKQKDVKDDGTIIRIIFTVQKFQNFVLSRITGSF